MFTSASSAAKDTNPNSPGAKDSARQMADDIREGARQVKKDIRETASNLNEDARTAAHETGQQMREFVDHATHNITDAAGSMTAQIRQNPVQSSLIALGIGVLVGTIMRR